MSRFLVTGGAGFIGSNVVRRLLALGEQVRVIDDCSTGRRANLADVSGDIEFTDGSIVDQAAIDAAIQGCDFCIHLAAIPSVPRSVENPARSHHANVTGTVNVLLAARDAGVQRVVMASSSSVYGNAATLPVEESLPVMPISPYAVSKASAEMYARVFSDLYEMEVVCLRYFNVFGPRQDPDSPYSAVIPLFIRRMLSGHAPRIHGDGLQSRDFTFVDNVATANIKACFAPGKIAECYNVAAGQPHSLLELVQTLNDILGTDIAPSFDETRAGDVKHSHAAIARAENAFGYNPRVTFREGLEQTVAWYRDQAAPVQTQAAVGD
jgi:nucleoside-diphosphate-sugar epimerase